MFFINTSTRYVRTQASPYVRGVTSLRVTKRAHGRRQNRTQREKITPNFDKKRRQKIFNYDLLCKSLKIKFFQKRLDKVFKKVFHRLLKNFFKKVLENTGFSPLSTEFSTANLDFHTNFFSELCQSNICHNQQKLKTFQKLLTKNRDYN